jgi:hypothetical protein
LIKTAQNKAFEGWPDWAYDLLRSAVYFVDDQKQARQIYNLFPNLKKSYRPPKDPDEMMITLGIIRRLKGDEAANQFLMENLDLPEFRKIAAEAAIGRQDYALAEKLCQEALTGETGGYYFKPSPWAYFLERIYEATNRIDDLTAIVRSILFKGDTSYFRKLKALYQQQEIWEKEQMPLWQELSVKIGISNYTALLSQEGELDRLLEAVKKDIASIEYYGKKLAAKYPEAAFQIYEEYILKEVGEASDRRKYKRVCSLLKGLAGAGGKTQALELIQRLSRLYPRRPAMLDELEGLRKKLTK